MVLDIFLGFGSGIAKFCGCFSEGAFFGGDLDLFFFVGDLDFLYDFDLDLSVLAFLSGFGVALLLTIFSVLSSCAAFMRASWIIFSAAGVSITYFGVVKSCLEVDCNDVLSGV